MESERADFGRAMMVFPMKTMNLWGGNTFPRYFPQLGRILSSGAPAFGQSLGWTGGLPGRIGSHAQRRRESPSFWSRG